MMETLLHPNPSYPDLSVLRIGDDWAIKRAPSIYTSRNNASKKLFDLTVVVAAPSGSPGSGCGEGIHILAPRTDTNGRVRTVWTKVVTVICAHTGETLRETERMIPDDVRKAIEKMRMEPEISKRPLEEGDPCPSEGCGGTMGWRPPENCSCHIAPPCSACVENPLTCDNCGYQEDEDDQEH